jgi:L-cysteine S-thiosulfotransferase
MEEGSGLVTSVCKVVKYASCGLSLLLGAVFGLVIANGAHAQQCKPKTAGYFTQMAAFDRTRLSPVQLAGIIKPVAEAIGNPARGNDIVNEPGRGDCLLCHRTPGASGTQGQGDVGPNLAGVGHRYTEPQLRQILVDPRVLFPGSVMPAYFKAPDGDRVPRDLAGKTVLSSQEVEDVVAYLRNLK